MKTGAPVLWAGAVASGVIALRAARRCARADLSGSVALITGGSRGLGLLLARELGREGCRVAICARDAAELASAVAALRADAIEALSVVCDVGERDQVDGMVATVTTRCGPIDLLVNNAGIIQVGPIQQLTVADFEQALDAMYWGVVYPTLAVLPSMRERHAGRIVNITSIGGKVSVPHLLPYSSAKFAAVGFSEGLRAECVRDGVSVTTIAPGLMRTGSQINALFTGERGREFTWFSLGASLPLVSMDAERAARQIVAAAKRGEAERVLSVPATLLSLFHGVAPGATANLLGVVDRFVLPPPAAEATSPEPGREVEQQQPSRLRDALTTLGRSAATRNNERPAPTPISAARG